jgi:hypothetical protein
MASPYQTFFPGFDIFIKPFYIFIGQNPTKCLWFYRGFLGYKGLTNRGLSGIIRYEGLGV